MASPNLPTLVLVPGAFGTPAGYDKLLPYFEQTGLPTVAGSYPSCDPDDPASATAVKDITALREIVLLPLIEQQGKDIVILAHSYGGVVAGGAAKGLDKPTRTSQGHTNGVVGLIYVAGNMTLEDESLLEAVGGAYPPFIKLDKPSKGLALIEPAMEILYNDCDSALSSELECRMLPHAHLAFETKATAPAWADHGFDGKRVYVRTLLGCCNPSVLQDMWLQKSRVHWDVVDFKTGHMPFESQPQRLAEQIIKSVRSFVAL
ncbi:hypothetical protein INS49_012471 [Diaporthe citri]|uniref:uncharacterized protein n=1 Tax=Diaporthe citri TaxID=83186 RepID=UPI001C7FBA98|nr:uncharacterized protein INS49_012471 [Diaporthe citri]KAG6358951.1 hypothetical protein INS49_012471 [Diaporthe citri]